MARELLDVQKYPDLRQYPSGPPLQPYDAAGWTLPLQMDVKMAAAPQPLSDEVRSKMKLLGPPPDPKLKLTPYNGNEAGDAAPFDSVPGIVSIRIHRRLRFVRPPGEPAGPAQPCRRSRTEQLVPRHQPRLAARGTVSHAGAAGGGARYVISG